MYPSHIRNLVKKSIPNDLAIDSVELEEVLTNVLSNVFSSREFKDYVTRFVEDAILQAVDSSLR